MSAQPQAQPASSKTRKPSTYHWIEHGGETALCGKTIPPRRQIVGTPARTQRIVCSSCETLRLMKNDLGW